MLMIVRKKIKYWALYIILRLVLYILQIGKNVILAMFQIVGAKKNM